MPIIDTGPTLYDHLMAQRRRVPSAPPPAAAPTADARARAEALVTQATNPAGLALKLLLLMLERGWAPPAWEELKKPPEEWTW